MAQELSGKKVAIIATDYFEEKELTSPLEALQQAGAEVEVIAPHDGEIQGVNHTDPGKKVTVNKTLDQANPNDYDALIVPGGAVNADHLRMEEKAREFIISMMEEQHKPTAVICHGPWLLVSARLVRGRRLTSFPTIQDDIRNAGGEWIDKEVVEDDNLITSRSPDDLPAFNAAIIKQLAEK